MFSIVAWLLAGLGPGCWLGAGWLLAGCWLAAGRRAGWLLRRGSPKGVLPVPLPLWPHRPMPSFQIQPGCTVSKSSSTGFRIQRLIPSFQIQPGGPVTKSRQLPNPGRFPNPSRSFRIQARLPNPGPSCRSPVAESFLALAAPGLLLGCSRP